MFLRDSSVVSGAVIPIVHKPSSTSSYKFSLLFPQALVKILMSHESDYSRGFLKTFIFPLPHKTNKQKMCLLLCV